jgi:signal transduction histidine kinase
MLLDGRTLLVVAALTAGLLSTFGVVLWTTGRSYPGCRRWVVAHLVLGLSLFLVAMRDRIPDVLSMLVANGLMYLSAGLTFESLGAFRGLASRRWPLLAGGAAALSMFGYFESMGDATARVMVSGIYLGTVLLACGFRLMNNIPKRRRLGFRIEGSIFVIFGVSLMVRGLLAYRYNPLAELYASHGVNWTTMTLAVLTFIGWSLGFILMATDRLVADLEDTQDQLNRANRELQAALEHADQANAAKSKFLADVSHEIRTPIGAVVSLADLLLETPLDETQRDYVSTARASGSSLLSLVNGLLDISKIEAGKIELDERPFQLEEILESTTSLLSATAKQKGLELRSYVDRDVPCELAGDPDRLRQVLTNLCGNAVKFTSRGHVTVRTSLDSGPDTEDAITLRFAVSDSGPGIPQDDVEQLFHRFTQSGHHHSGTGLGLAISKQLVELMGGKIGVESTLGRGSTFWFTVLMRRSAGNRSTEADTLLASRG